MNLLDMLASVVLAVAAAQTQDVMIVASVMNPGGDQATFFGTMIGASRRITARMGALWIRRTDGSWTWIKASQKSVAWGPPRGAEGDAGTWEPMAADGPSEAVLTYAGPEGFSARVHTPGSPDATLSYVVSSWGKDSFAQHPERKMRLSEALLKLKDEERDWASRTPGTWGIAYAEGQVQLVQFHRDGGRSLAVTAEDPLAPLPRTAWSTAQTIVPGALGAMGSEAAGWGFVLGPDTVQLAPFSRGRFSPTARSQAFASPRLISFQVFMGEDIRALDGAVRQLHTP